MHRIQCNSTNILLTVTDFLKEIVFIYLFLERGEGREKEKERETSVCGCLSHAPTRDLA